MKLFVNQYLQDEKIRKWAIPTRIRLVVVYQQATLIRLLVITWHSKISSQSKSRIKEFGLLINYLPFLAQTHKNFCQKLALFFLIRSARTRLCVCAAAASCPSLCLLQGRVRSRDPYFITWRSCHVTADSTASSFRYSKFWKLPGTLLKQRLTRGGYNGLQWNFDMWWWLF